MSEMSSFYGGRHGAAFIIVERFDGIDIPQPGDGSGVTEYTYTSNQYAVGEFGQFIITTKEQDGNVLIPGTTDKYLIERNKDNYTKYGWQYQENDGSRINNTSYQFPEQLARGMVQCFKEGTKSASKVNFGEYVLIDTIYNFHNLSHPDNGKVFRRGMDVQSELAGAEYIGQIVGPQGESPELDITTEKDIWENHSPYKRGNYNQTEENGGLIPGYFVNGFSSSIEAGTYINDVLDEVLNLIENPVQNTLYRVYNGITYDFEYYTYNSSEWIKEDLQFNDKITYSWSTMRDPHGNIIGCLIGFTFPYLVFEMAATAVNSHYHRDGEGLPIRNKNLTIREDDGTHPYYQRWRILVPEGVHGDDVNRLELVNTQIAIGVPFYSDINRSNQVGTTTGYINIDYENTDFTLPYIEFKVGNNTYYVDNDDISTTSTILRYTETTYKRKEEGESRFVNIGSYKTIKDINVESDGSLVITYTYDGIKRFDKRIKWIDAMRINQTGEVQVQYNTRLDPNSWETISTLNFISYITIDDDGTVKYYYSRDLNVPSFQQDKLIKWITDVDIDTRDGNGDQKISVSYNNDSYNGVLIEKIGDPLNNILEVAISESRAESYQTLPFHLLVLYTDPIKRQEIKNKGENAIYRSIYPDADGNYVRDDWHDLGNIRGVRGGFNTILEIANENELFDDNGTVIPSEYILYAASERAKGNGYIFDPLVGRDEYYGGWGVTKVIHNIDPDTGADDPDAEFWFYDYELNKWYSVGRIGDTGAKPEEVLYIGEENDIHRRAAMENLREKGFWLITSLQKFAN